MKKKKSIARSGFQNLCREFILWWLFTTKKQSVRHTEEKKTNATKYFSKKKSWQIRQLYKGRFYIGELKVRDHHSGHLNGGLKTEAYENVSGKMWRHEIIRCMDLGDVLLHCSLVLCGPSVPSPVPCEPNWKLTFWSIPAYFVASCCSQNGSQTFQPVWGGCSPFSLKLLYLVTTYFGGFWGRLYS